MSLVAIIFPVLIVLFLILMVWFFVGLRRRRRRRREAKRADPRARGGPQGAQGTGGNPDTHDGKTRTINLWQ
jgi:hypothetical protein